MVILPGVLVRVHVPDEGRLLRVMVPVATVHVGWIVLPATGATGVTGCSLIVTPVDAAEMQPDAFVTVNVYVPAAIPEIVAVVPLPVEVTDPGIRVTVHVPEEGNPVSGTLPVATEHVGCVAVPVTGAEGVTGC